MVVFCCSPWLTATAKPVWKSFLMEHALFSKIQLKKKWIHDTKSDVPFLDFSPLNVSALPASLKGQMENQHVQYISS